MKLTHVANLINLFCLIYTTIGVLPVVLTEVMLLGAEIKPKKSFFEIDTWDRIHDISFYS